MRCVCSPQSCAHLKMICKCAPRNDMRMRTSKWNAHARPMVLFYVPPILKLRSQDSESLRNEFPNRRLSYFQVYLARPLAQSPPSGQNRLPFPTKPIRAQSEIWNLTYTGGIPQRSDTDVHSDVTAKNEQVAFKKTRRIVYSLSTRYSSENMES